VRGSFNLVLVAAFAACARTDLIGPTASSRADADAGGDAGGDASEDEETVSRRPCTWGGFVVKETHETGSYPDALVVADLDGDGRLDLVVTNWGGPNGSLMGSVSVYLAQGPGTFAPQVSYPTDIEAACVSVGDFTGDGRLDLAAGTVLGYVDVMLNAGGGTFKPLPTANFSLGGGTMAAADFDGDGRIDLAMAVDNHSIAVFRGNGDGTFSASGGNAMGTNAGLLVPSDLDGDGDVDLLLGNVAAAPGVGLPTGLGAGTVNVLMNQGDGSFSSQTTYAAGNGTIDLAVGDVDGDGHPDVVVANSVDQAVGVLRNVGDGTLEAPRAYPIGVDIVGIALADFDGDGRLDVATTSDSSTSGTVWALLNAGDGTFGAAVPGPGPRSARSLAAGDFDGDGRSDLAITTDQDTVSVLLATCR
jgi:hypothetical protein